MQNLFTAQPGRLFLLATLLPLFAAVLMLVITAVRSTFKNTTSKIPHYAAYVVLVAMLGSAVCSSLGLYQILSVEEYDRSQWTESINWLSFGSSTKPMTVQLGYRIDTLSAAAITMVCIVTSLIVLFSMGYMHDEAKDITEDHALHVKRRGRFGRFFVLLALFAFSMLNLLIANNLFQVFISWELVGVCSFFLIGFYSERPSASAASNKAFIMNRIGDAGFLIALFIAWTEFKTFDIFSLNQQFAIVPAIGAKTFLHTLFGLGLFLGCVGKSAQLPLQTWLPDAMEGPTPVSALIHAATMVAAGVYLVGRCFAMFTSDVLMTIAVIGALTAFISATIATVQNDIKRVLAFSTCSQLGLMMMSLGLGGWTAGLLHLLTHAFFKALLFLGAGSVIHACHHEQDLRKMGGLRHKLPITAYTMLIGVLAISGIPFLSGWYSKDQIVGHVFGHVAARGVDLPTIVIVFCGVCTVGLTAYYMTRLWMMAFTGEPREKNVEEHAHESPWVMTLPLLILALFSVVVAWGWPLWSPDHSYLGQVITRSSPRQILNYADVTQQAHHYHYWAMALALGLSALGISIGAMRNYSEANEQQPVDHVEMNWLLFFEKRWFFDDIYDFFVKKPVLEVSKATAVVDKSRYDVGAHNVGYDATSVDGWLAAFATFVSSIGLGLKQANKGKPRVYILALAISTIAMMALLTKLLK
jgi:NADH-quinone oxidoreductase subunit L